MSHSTTAFFTLFNFVSIRQVIRHLFYFVFLQCLWGELSMLVTVFVELILNFAV